jgi:vacuolar-type H+-ATPase subunit I/STV1
MKHKIKSNIRKVRSLDDLRSEKQRLKSELQKTEEGIHSGYHHIREMLSFHNILKTVTKEIATTSNFASKTFSIGKKILEKVKKKKKKKKERTKDFDDIITNE